MLFRSQLNPKKTYAIQYTLNVCASSTAEGRGAILLKQSLSGAFTDALPLYFAMEHLRAPQTLHAVSVLYPRMNGGREVGISLALDAKTPLYVERAVIDIVEI